MNDKNEHILGRGNSSAKALMLERLCKQKKRLMCMSKVNEGGSGTRRGSCGTDHMDLGKPGKEL